MRIVEPEVYLLAQTSMDVKPPKAFKGNLQSYLEKVGAAEWKTTHCSDGEMLVEVAGRLCYKAFGIGLNNNLTRVREGNEVYLENLAKQDHTSVQEHSTVSFLFQNVSRILTHELVRHRVGVAISQESGRYVRADDIGFYMPDCFNSDLAVRGLIRNHIESGESLARQISSRFLLNDPGTSFARKKEITSAIRRFAPFGHASSLVWTTNHRNLRFVLQKRTEGGAEEEIRKLFDPVGYGMKEMFPNLYSDIYRRESGEWVSLFSVRGLADSIRETLDAIERGGLKLQPDQIIRSLLKERGL